VNWTHTLGQSWGSSAVIVKNIVFRVENMCNVEKFLFWTTCYCIPEHLTLCVLLVYLTEQEVCVTFPLECSLARHMTEAVPKNFSLCKCLQGIRIFCESKLFCRLDVI
jgi:hypothetical protein